MSDTTPTSPPPENDPGSTGSTPPGSTPSGASTPPPTSPPPGYDAPGQGSPQQGYPPQGAPEGYGAPPPPAAAGPGAPADLLMRFLARLIDFILLAIVTGIISFVIGSIFGLRLGSYGLSVGEGLAATAVSAVVSTAITLGYFWLMESRNGQTVGKMLLKLQTQGPDGQPPTSEQALKRNAWTALGILGVIPVLGFVGSLLELVAVIMIAVTISQSPVREGWHDRWAGGTKVVKTG